MPEGNVTGKCLPVTLLKEEINSMFRKSTLVAAVLGAFFLIGGVVPLQARNPQCEQRVRKAEANLHEAIRRHGERSRQAEQRRRELEQVRANCRMDDHRDHDRR